MSKVQSISTEQIVSQVEGNIVSNMNGEKVMLSVQNGKYYNLGELGGEIWDQLEKPITIEALVTELMKQYQVERVQCEQHTIEFVCQLIAEGIVRVHE